MTEGLFEKMFKTFGELYLDPYGDLRESSDTLHSGIVDVPKLDLSCDVAPVGGVFDR